MINIKALQQNLTTLVGFEQNTNTDYPTLDADLLVSDSGLYVQKVHPLLSVENIANCVKKPASELNAFLKAKRLASIANLVNRVYTEKQLNETGKELLTEVRLYDGTGNFNDKVVNQNRFVGFKVAAKEEDLCMIMRMIGLQFDSANPTLKIYIYHSSQSEPVKTIDINYDKPNSFLWKTFDKLDLPFIGGGYYIIGYYQNDLTGQAINREQVFTKMPGCSSCNAINYGYYNKWFKLVKVQPVYVNTEDIDLNDHLKWDGSKEVTVDSTNFGLNLSISVVCDASAKLIRVKEIFSHALSLQIGVDLLTELAYSTRDNQSQLKVSQMAMYALTDAEEKLGMKSQLDKAIKALSFNMSDINPLCLPCNDEGQRVRMKTVF